MAAHRREGVSGMALTSSRTKAASHELPSSSERRTVSISRLPETRVGPSTWSEQTSLEVRPPPEKGIRVMNWGSIERVMNWGSSA